MDSVEGFTFVVIGGGIAGVSCVEQILELNQHADILLISASPVVKEAANVTKLSKTVQDFIVVEKSLKSFKDVHKSVKVIHDELESLLFEEQMVLTKGGTKYKYKKLCICTGGRPKLIYPDNPYVVGIRDTATVKEFSSKIAKAKKILLVGNGGIATELVHELSNMTIVWVVRDKSISARFLDAGAGEFILMAEKSRSNNRIGILDSTSQSKSEAWTAAPSESGETQEITVQPSKRMRYTITSINLEGTGENAEDMSKVGSALGPDWHSGLVLEGGGVDKYVSIQYETECVSILRPEELLPEQESRVIQGIVFNGKE